MIWTKQYNMATLRIEQAFYKKKKKKKNQIKGPITDRMGWRWNRDRSKWERSATTAVDQQVRVWDRPTQVDVNGSFSQQCPRRRSFFFFELFQFLDCREGRPFPLTGFSNQTSLCCHSICFTRIGHWNNWKYRKITRRGRRLWHTTHSFPPYRLPHETI